MLTKNAQLRRFFFSNLWIFILFISPVVGSAERPPAKKKSPDAQALESFFSIPFFSIVSVYRDFSGKAKPSLCNMHPSCSAYGVESVTKRGPFIGTLKTIDRLNRCGHDVERYPSTWTDRGVKYRDPVEN